MSKKIKRRDEEDASDKNNSLNDDFTMYGRIPKFEGFVSDVSDWVEDFERTALLSGWDDDRKS